MAAYGDPAQINDWIFQKPGATIDTPANLKAAQHLQKWIKAGYFPEDANAMDYATMMGEFIGGNGLFMFNGDWESGNLDKQMPGNVGFFLLPDRARPAASTRRCRRPLTFGIAAKAKNADCAAFFLNWVAHQRRGPRDRREVGGSHPMGPADAADADGRRRAPSLAETLDGGAAARRRTTARWTSSPTPPARSSPRAGPRSCRSWSPGSRPRRGC